MCFEVGKFIFLFVIFIIQQYVQNMKFVIFLGKKIKEVYSMVPEIPFFFKKRFFN
jgi:hypothetical protein